MFRQLVPRYRVGTFEQTLSQLICSTDTGTKCVLPISPAQKCLEGNKEERERKKIEEESRSSFCQSRRRRDESRCQGERERDEMKEGKEGREKRRGDKM